MKTADQSQDPLFVEENPFLSMLFLDLAICPHLTKHESAILMGVWHRTARFGYIGATKMTYSVMRDGNGETPIYEGVQSWKEKRFPVFLDLSEKQYKRSMSPLLKLGLLTRMGVGMYRISCYPRDYVDPSKRLLTALKGVETAQSTDILQGLFRVTDTLLRFKRL